MARKVVIFVLALSGTYAICTDSFAKTLDLIQNEKLRAYAAGELEGGAPSLPVTSKILHREALEDIAQGRRDAAVGKLRLAADLSGDYAAPLFTLTRVQFLRGKPEFIVHFAEGVRRSFSGFPRRDIAVLNCAALAVLAMTGALLAVLAGLLVRYWPFIDHKIVERCSRRFSFPPARWVVPLAVIALVLLRLGLVVYVAVLVAVLWAYLSKRERIVVFSMVAIIAAGSIASLSSNRLSPAVDPGSVARRLALVNQRAVSPQRLSEIRAISGERFRGERDFAIGTMLYRLGLFDEAREHLLDAVSARPNFAAAFCNLGNVYFMQGDYDRALAGYRSAVELDSTSTVAHYNIGQTYIKKMLFAQSGVWLQRASTLGLERYLRTHPALGMRSAPVYEQGFPPKYLRAIAASEGASRGRVILGEMLQPFLLVPFHTAWAILAAGLVAGLLVARKLPAEWRVLRCDNCGRATCPRCAEVIHDVRLCRDCAGIVGEISSFKVMEALLRTKRQKHDGALERAHRWGTMLIPGMAHVYHGNLARGFLIAFAGFAALGMLAWRGLCFKDPLAANVGEPLWESILPIVVLAAAYAITITVKRPQESRNYHLFPAQIRSLEHVRAKTKVVEDTSDLWLSPQSDPPTRRNPPRESAPPPPPEPAAPDPSHRPRNYSWGDDALHRPPPPPRKSEKAKNTGTSPEFAKPSGATTGVDLDDFLAEIKKGSSWR